MQQWKSQPPLEERQTPDFLLSRYSETSRNRPTASVSGPILLQCHIVQTAAQRSNTRAFEKDDDRYKGLILLSTL